SAASSAAAQSGSSSGLGSLDQGDFLRLMTVQMQHQDPFDPVDQKEMLAQMAQFSSLAGIAEVNSTLKTIAARIDALSAMQPAATDPAQPTTSA
ncbi:MAG: flagellar hook assembly protein FlgD, partial [Novosphingobium sp.]